MLQWIHRNICRESQGPLPHATTDSAKSGVNFTRRRAEDERDNSVSSNFDVLERSKDMYFSKKRQDRWVGQRWMRKGNARVSKDDPCPAGIFDCKFGLSILARYTAYIQCKSDMISRKDVTITYRWREIDGLREASWHPWSRTSQGIGHLIGGGRLRPDRFVCEYMNIADIER